MDMKSVTLAEDALEPATGDPHVRALRELGHALDAHALVSITDSQDRITRVNDKFCSTSGYTREELLGATHRIINSGQHSPAFFAELWSTISSGRIWKGEICNRARNGSLYWVQSTIVPVLDALGRPREYVSILTNVTERKGLELRLQHQACHDELTGLPNRRYLLRRLREVLAARQRDGLHGALLLLDLDHFKDINDSLGHHAGDQLLKVVARRLTAELVQKHDVVRLGGDEFVVLMPGQEADRGAAVATAFRTGEAIRSMLKAMVWLDSSHTSSTCSMGVVIFNGGQATPAKLLQWADIALYDAKGRGRDTLTIFDEQLQRSRDATAELRAGLQRLVKERAFTLHYQAVVDAQRRVIGVEALARMVHPERGILPPAEFIPHLEKTGDVIALGEWVLAQACEQLARWSEYPACRDLHVAVNISARHFQAEQFVPSVLELLGLHNLHPCRLRIEITESALLTDVPQAIHKMQVLKASGVTFAIDDFGTGYSSLSYLRRLPIDVIKLDRSFIQDVIGSGIDNTIVCAVLGLARGLGVTAVAEGVETEEQFEWLRRIGCPTFQGFLFSRPHPDIQAVIAGETGLSTHLHADAPGLSATMPLFCP